MRTHGDHRPIVFAKYDSSPEQESLRLTFRPDRSTTKGETQITIPTVDLDHEVPSELQHFIDDARPLLAKTAEVDRDRPIELLDFDDCDPISLDERLKRWTNEGPEGWFNCAASPPRIE